MRATRIATPATASRGDGRGGPPAQVKVQLHVSKTRVMKIMRGYDTAASGWVSASDLALGLKRLGLSNDYVTVLLKQLDSETIRDQNMVDYKRFFATITVHDPADAAKELDSAVRAAVALERSRFTRILSGIADDELQSTGAVHERTLQLDEELKRCRGTLDACGGQMVADGKSLMQQMAEFRAQCRRETATALTMVVEARKALAWVTEDKEQTEQHRDRLGAELSRSTHLYNTAGQDKSTIESSFRAAEDDAQRARAQLTKTAAENEYLKQRIRELDEELAATCFHLTTSQEHNTTLIHECRRLRGQDRDDREARQ